MDRDARVAVVLGAGGSVGHAFHAGVLAALQEATGWDARRADLLVGTSAGSIVSSLLRAGLSPADLARRAQRRPLSDAGRALVARASLAPPGSNLPPRTPPSSGMASPQALRRAVRAPWRLRLGSLAAAAMPAGRISTDAIAQPIRSLYGEGWAAEPTWIVAVDLDSSQRVVFGRDPEVSASLADAVRASCAIPGFFEPVDIGGRRYVDGGVHSTTNADVVVGARPDLVIISAPMSTRRGAARGVELPMRQWARASLVREVARLRARRIPVLAFQPNAADLAVMGGDPLDQRKIAPVCRQVLVSAREALERPAWAAALSRLAAAA